MKTLLKGLSRGAEFIAAMTLAAIFITFILQIFTRYASKMAWMFPVPAVSEWMASVEPLRWTVYLISVLWVWLIFFGCSFLVRERDHVAFDIVYHSVPDRWRKVLAIVGALTVIGVMIYSFMPVYDALWASRLMELKKLQTIRMPITGDKIAMKWLFAPFIMLMIVVSMRYLWSLFSVFKYGAPKDHHEQLLEELQAEKEDQQ